MKYRQARWDEPLLIELSGEGRCGLTLPFDPELSREVGDVLETIPKNLRRADIRLPQVAQPQITRHYIRLSQMNYSVDSGTYPLGSCTMKHNPKIIQRILANTKVRKIHPEQPDEYTQGLMKILFELGTMLAEIVGLPKFSLQPAAGAQGEFTGVLMIRAWLKDRGQLNTRNEILIPDTAHGTNPASAAMAGFKVIEIPSTEDGLVDVEAIKAVAGRSTAGMMMTVPNTLGLFEKHIKEVINIIHEVGGLMYYDGANLNALIGRVRPGDIGFDIAHLNLHKTFGTPHGGGGPGAGPVFSTEELGEYLPKPTLEFDGQRYRWCYDRPKSVGRVRSYFGNISVLLGAYIYCLLMGRDGLKDASALATLAANYLMSKLDRRYFDLHYFLNIRCKHEFVASAKVSALEVAKLMLDYGVHPPTIYFPITVPEAMMIEPTESESVEELDNYAEVLNKAAEVASKDPKAAAEAPHNTATPRVDEVRASHPRTLKVRW
ncbi:MAG: aminomethyl-transferring glycine dehydrogenase subunit GcvPB [Nitrososphaerales archaeon]